MLSLVAMRQYENIISFIGILFFCYWNLLFCCFSIFLSFFSLLFIVEHRMPTSDCEGLTEGCEEKERKRERKGVNAGE